MKTKIVVLAAFLLLGVSSVKILAEERADENILTKEAVSNYLVGINSDNEGLRISCAYYLGEYKVEEAIIPLMKMLNSEKNEDARIIAALSLAKIGTGKAIYAVKQASVLDSSERVRTLCARFYSSLAMEKQKQSDY